MHKSGFVNIIGNPNAGKSTLINAFWIKSCQLLPPRHKQPDIESLEFIIRLMCKRFSDTPGIIKPDYALQERMMDATYSTFEDADIMLLLVAADDKRGLDENTWKRIANFSGKLILVFNKVDLSNQKGISTTCIIMARKSTPSRSMEYFCNRIFPRFGVAGSYCFTTT